MANHLIHDKFVGAYVYAIKVDGVVRYIGKGRRKRALEHLRKAKEVLRLRAAGQRPRVSTLYRRLSAALEAGARIEHEVMVNGLTDEDALYREFLEIDALPASQLWNTVPGGVGNSGAVMRQLWESPEFRRKVMTSRRAQMYENEEWRERQRQAAVAQWADPEKRRRHNEQHRKLWDDPAAAEDRRALLRKVWADPEKTERKRALVKSQWTPERRAAMSENRRRAWADPAFKARAAKNISAAQSKPERAAANRERALARWADDDFKARTTEKIKAAKTKNDRPG